MPLPDRAARAEVVVDSRRREDADAHARDGGRGRDRVISGLGRDSGHRVSSGVATFHVDGDSSRIGISIVLDDYRAGWGGGEREWLLSWVYAGRLFQGSARETKDFLLGGGDVIMRGHVAIKNGTSWLYVGTFRFEFVNANKPNQSYALVLRGKVTDDPLDHRHLGSTKLYPIKARPPCIDIST